MGKKNRKQNKQSNNSKNKQKNSMRQKQDYTNLVIERINNSSSEISVEEVLKCRCFKNGYCIVRDDECKPNTFKCIKNKDSHKNQFFTSSIPTGITYKKVVRYSAGYNPYTDERYGNNEKIETIDIPIKRFVLYVFKGFLNIKQKYAVDVYINLPNMHGGKSICVLVAYNTRTKKYYISDTQLKWLHKNNHYPAVRYCPCNEGTKSWDDAMFSELSILALYGYSVGKNGLKTEERQKIIKYIIDNGIMMRYQVIQHLQGLINLREGRMDKDFSRAIQNWKEDIIFLNKRGLKK